MRRYISAKKLIEYIKSRRDGALERQKNLEKIGQETVLNEMIAAELNRLISFIDSLQQEKPEVDLEKLGEITRHLIAVKDHEEDMRLDEGEWLLLERIGYPERFNARKEE